MSSETGRTAGVATRPRRALAVLRDGTIVAVMSLLLLGTIELGVRWIAPQDVRVTYLAGESAAIRDETLGHLYRPGSHMRKTGPEFTVEYRINPDGHRDEAAHPRPREPETLRVLLVGDSFAMGAANAYEDSFPVIFERRVQRQLGVDVVKAGVSGYDTRRELLYLERLLPEYRPDVVLLAFLPNDLFTNRALERVQARVGGSVEEETGEIRGTSDKDTTLHLVTLAKRLLMSNDALYLRLYVGTRRAEYFAVPPTDHVAGQIEVTRQLLLQTRDLCRSAGAEFAVLSIPQLYQVIDGAREDPGGAPPSAYIDRTFADFARERGFPWISSLDALVDAYRDGEDGLYYRLDGHLQPEGNRIVGELLAKEFLARYGGSRTDRPGVAGGPDTGDSSR